MNEWTKTNLNLTANGLCWTVVRMVSSMGTHILTAARGATSSVFFITFSATSVWFHFPRNTFALVKTVVIIRKLSLELGYSQPSNANQRPKFNVKRCYCPWFQVHVLTACRLEILETVCQESKFLRVSSSFINTSLKRSDHRHRHLLRYVWHIWLIVAGWT